MRLAIRTVVAQRTDAAVWILIDARHCGMVAEIHRGATIRIECGRQFPVRNIVVAFLSLLLATFAPVPASAATDPLAVLQPLTLGPYPVGCSDIAQNITPPVGVLSVLQYWRAGHVNIAVALWAAVGFLAGGWVGGTIAQLIAGRVLRRLFALLLLAFALDLFRR